MTFIFSLYCSIVILKAYVRCTVDETGEPCQEYFDTNPFPKERICNTTSSSREQLPITFEWELCNTNQQLLVTKKILDKYDIEAWLRQEKLPTWETKRIRKRDCETIAKRKEVLDRCEKNFFLMRLSVKEKNKKELCIDQRAWYRVKNLAECLSDVKVSIFK